MKKFLIKVWCCFLLAGVYPADAVLAEKCYMAKEGFGVAQPYMVTRGCFLFHHGANMNLENESEMVVAREGEYSPDPLHTEFVRFVIDRKLIALKKDTPLFSCAYDLQTVSRDFKYSGGRDNKTRTLGYELPKYSCRGVTSPWAPVRPLNESHCFWVAVQLIRCDAPGSELEPMSVTDPETDDEE